MKTLRHVANVTRRERRERRILAERGREAGGGGVGERERERDR